VSRDTLIPALQRLLASSATRSVAGTAFELAAIDVLGRGRIGYPVRPLFVGMPAMRQHDMEMVPSTVIEQWLALPQQQRDVIDQAAES
jgi:hypothetical protein